jgi:phage gpG-like protein
MSEVKIEWDMHEVNAMMEKLRAAGQSGAKALVAGGEVAVAQAKINAENQGLHDTGKLINSIGVYDITPYSVMVGSRGVVYNAAHEFGVTIYPKRKRFLSLLAYCF